MSDKIMLYLIATPIGNLGDISSRALEILESCDIVACEDTRQTGKLLHHFKIKKKMISYHEHNKISRGEELINFAKEGKIIALVSDAGCPGISDPGEELVKGFYEALLTVSVIPGPSAAISALMISGLPTSQFAFYGFLPIDNKKRKSELEKLANEEKTIILYEAPHRLLKTLNYLAEYIEEEREISIVREITKIYEEVIRGTLKSMIDNYESKTPKGEFVIIIKGGISNVVNVNSNIPVDIRYQQLLEQNYSRKDAMRIITKEKNMSRRDVYSIINK
ncbi:MAG: 16S rRNA (cytidine(1402)-2'-O)-methyltransferase [Clostridiales bacterium]|nr:16S rRNA (cytidine(1402)-2'-O)-methyltransferase [Clostridiales bacterium]